MDTDPEVWVVRLRPMKLKLKGVKIESPGIVRLTFQRHPVTAWAAVGFAGLFVLLVVVNQGFALAEHVRSLWR